MVAKTKHEQAQLSFYYLKLEKSDYYVIFHTLIVYVSSIRYVFCFFFLPGMTENGAEAEQ